MSVVLEWYMHKIIINSIVNHGILIKVVENFSPSSNSIYFWKEINKVILFGAHSQNYLGITPSFVFRSHSWMCSRGPCGSRDMESSPSTCKANAPACWSLCPQKYISSQNITINLNLSRSSLTSCFQKH